MLTATEIGNFIANPNSIGVNDLDELQQLADKHPYSQVFSILYLKGMSANNSVDFEAALKQHSFRVSDRAQLYHLIHDHNAEPSVESVVTLETEITAEISQPSEEKQTEPAVIEPKEAPIEISVETNDEEATTEEQETPTFEHLTEQVEEEQESSDQVESLDEKLDATPSPEIELPEDPLDQRILHHVFANNYQLDALSEEEESALENRKVKESEESSPAVAEKNQVDLEVENETTRAANDTPEDVEIDASQTFTSWLRSNSNYEVPASDEKEAIAAVVNEFSEFDPMESLFGTVEKPKKEFFSPAKKAKESLSENQLPVSETLAKIYVMQGNYPKAIEAYKELSLAFPEKKIFFANQIEDLQKNLNR